MKIAQIFTLSKQILEKNAPTILTGMAVCGVGITAILAGKATIKAEKILGEKNLENSDKWELAKEILPLYIPTIIMGASTCACIIGANKINLKRQAAFAGLYSISEAKLKKYAEKLDPEAKKMTDEDRRRDAIFKTPPPENRFIMRGKGGNTLCFDMLTGRYFFSDMMTIREAAVELNRRLEIESYLSLNDFYWHLNLDGVRLGNEVGFNYDCPLKIEFSSQLYSDGTPVLVIDYEIVPTSQYLKYSGERPW